MLVDQIKAFQAFLEFLNSLDEDKQKEILQTLESTELGLEAVLKIYPMLMLKEQNIPDKPNKFTVYLADKDGNKKVTALKAEMFWLEDCSVFKLDGNFYLPRKTLSKLTNKLPNLSFLHDIKRLDAVSPREDEFRTVIYIDPDEHDPEIGGWGDYRPLYASNTVVSNLLGNQTLLSLLVNNLIEGGLR